MYERGISYRRRVRQRAIARKTFIGTHCMLWENLETDERAIGRLAKGKVHCSCPLCACKSTKVLGKHTNSLIFYSASDRRKFDSLADSYEEAS